MTLKETYEGAHRNFPYHKVVITIHAITFYIQLYF